MRMCCLGQLTKNCVATGIHRCHGFAAAHHVTSAWHSYLFFSNLTPLRRVLIASIMEEYDRDAWEQLIQRCEVTGVAALETSL